MKIHHSNEYLIAKIGVSFLGKGPNELACLLACFDPAENEPCKVYARSPRTDPPGVVERLNARVAGADTTPPSDSEDAEIWDAR